MVACPQCAARFAAATEIEKQWYDATFSGVTVRIA